MTAPPAFAPEVHELLFEHAQQVAHELGHGQVEPEDILLAATRVNSTAQLFRHLGVQPQELAQRLFSLARRGSFTQSGKREYSVRSGRQMILMWRQARRTGANELGAPQVLVAVLQPPPKRFLFLFRLRVPPFWAELQKAGITEATVQRAIDETRGAA